MGKIAGWLFAAVLGLVGITLAVGGVMLAVDGGSLYYVAAGLAVLDAGLFQLAGGGAPVRALLAGEADLGVGGVGALVDQGAPGDRVALAVAGEGGVAVVGVGLQQVAVDLDDRDVTQVAGGAAQARPGGAGYGNRAAGDDVYRSACLPPQTPEVS